MNKLKARIDAFNRLIVDAKATGVWDSIEAACIMAGWSNVAGALTPLKGAAPTNNGFIDSDLDAGIGLVGDNTNKYVNSNRAGNADGQNDNHVSVYVTSPSRLATSRIVGNSVSGTTAGITTLGDQSGFGVFARNNSLAYRNILGEPLEPSLVGASRSEAARYQWRFNGQQRLAEDASDGNIADNMIIYKFSATDTVRTDATLSWYSIGSSVDLAALDTVVSQLAADLRAIDEDGFDPLATDYIRRVEAADGAYLETGVKQAINAFVVGCRKDGILDAIKASCIMAGARTISGALVPLVGDAPTPYNFTASDYSRTTGLKGDGSTTYLDTNRNNNADPQDSKHYSVYMTDANSFASPYPRILVAGGSTGNDCHFVGGINAAAFLVMSVNNAGAQNTPATGSSTGFMCASRSVSTSYQRRMLGSTTTVSAVSGAPSDINFGLFTVIGNSGNRGDSRIAFYSIGEALDPEALDNRVSTLISSISTALS